MADNYSCGPWRWFTPRVEVSSDFFHPLTIEGFGCIEGLLRRTKECPPSRRWYSRQSSGKSVWSRIWVESPLGILPT